MAYLPLKGPGQSQERSRAARWTRLNISRAKVLILAIVAVVIVLAIGLGVGLGVGLRNRQQDSTTTLSQASPLQATPANASIWQPQVAESWQIVLLSAIQLDTNATAIVPDVDIFDIDLFLTNKSTIDTLHSLHKKVICYFSAGSYEPGRPDSGEFNKSDLGHELAGWPGEKWLNLRSDNVRHIMGKRLALASSKGCDGVDPDNMDAYANDNGLGMTTDDSINFMGWLTSTAQTYKLSVGLKNAQAILPQVLPAIQYVVNEQCVQYSECTSFTPAITAGKPVFHIEYPDQDKQATVAQFCGDTGAAAGANGFSTVLKKLNLNGWVENCNGTISTTPTQ